MNESIATQQEPVCPICEGKMKFSFSVPCDYRKPGIRKKYDTFWCAECDYGQIWDRPSVGEIAGFYTVEDYYTHSAAHTNASSDTISWLDRLRAHISWRLDAGDEFKPADSVPKLQGKDFTMCEIGCGNGTNLQNFRAQGFSVYGVEPDPDARSQALKSIEYIFNGTAEQLPAAIADNKYDVVLMSHVLEHCRDINAAMRNAAAILKMGGTLIVETPNCQSLGFNTYRGEWPWTDIPRHLNFFTPVSLEKIITKHGLQIASKRYRGFCRQFSNSWLTNEKQIWSAFSRYGDKNNAQPNYKVRAWNLLLRSVFVSRASKYDSVWVTGCKA